MPIWGWVLVGIAVVIVIVVSALLALDQRQTSRLRGRFGPEYDRAVQARGGRREAEAHLRDREQRRSRMDIRPLSPDSRRMYEDEWDQVQIHFVDDPSMAVREADQLIQIVMREEGYPIEEFDRRADDLSVDHPRVVDNYRKGHSLAMASAQCGPSGTEDLRQAMRHYRNLFSDLVEIPENHDVRHGQDEATPKGTGDGAVPQ